MPIEDVVVTNDYLRLDTKIEELKKSIRAVGLLHPLIVNQKNELIAGGRRFSALRELGIEQVPVVVVEHNVLEQELISIDENLIRLPLNSIQMEKALNRGRDIYESLYPSAKKVETDPEQLDKKAAKGEETEEDFDDDLDKVSGEASFVEVTAQKTGLSEGAIRSAIIRDERSSPLVKEARVHGEIGATQANELVKLDKDAQDKILPIVKDRSTKDIRKIIKDAKANGVDATIERVMSEEQLPKEYEQLFLALQKFNRLTTKVIAEKIRCPELHKAVFTKLSDKAVDLLQQLIDHNEPEDIVEEEEDDDDDIDGSEDEFGSGE